MFLSPETKYLRSPTALNGEVVFTDEFGTTHILSDEEVRARFGDLHEHGSVPVEKKSFMKTLMPFNKLEPGGLKIWLGVYGKILKCCTSPGVIFATLASSISLGEIYYVEKLSTELTFGYLKGLGLLFHLSIVASLSRISTGLKDPSGFST